MRFEEERYVRVYTRDTTTILMLSWEARALMWETFRKLDRAGLLDLGDDGLAALSAQTRIPPEIVDRAFPELVRRGVLELRGSVLVAPRFLEAQEAKTNDPARARAYRERLRDLARAETLAVTSRDAVVTPRDAPVTARDETVTPHHTASLCAVPFRAVPSRAGGEALALRALPGHVVGAPTEATPEPTLAPPKTPKTPKTPRGARGTRLPEEWRPTPELLDRLRRELRVDPEPAIRRFVTYWVNATRNALKPRWDLAFENWVERDKADGKLPAIEPEYPIHRAPGREKHIPKSVDEVAQIMGKDAVTAT